MSGDERRGSRGAAVRFRRRLAELKRNGCNLLVVGTDALDAACERLLGESSAGPRYRLFVTTDARPATARAKLAAVQAGPYADEAAIVDWQAGVRGGTTADARGGASLGDAPPADSSPFDSPRSDSTRGSAENGPDEGGDATVRRAFVERDALGDLGAVVEQEIERFAADAGSLSPAELRLCFDSLTPLGVGRGDDGDAREFLGDLTETVERYDGMGHYHLSAEYDSEAVRSVESLFDGVVEVRYVSEEVEQRWHLADPDVTTDWLPL